VNASKTLSTCSGGHADTSVADGECQPVGARGRFPRDDQRDGPVLGELRSVAEQVEQRLADLRQVGSHRADVAGAPHLQRVGIFVDERLDHRDDVPHEVRNEGLQVQVHLAGQDEAEQQGRDEAECGDDRNRGREQPSVGLEVSSGGRHLVQRSGLQLAHGRF
jgi:hypothetical protein